MDHTPVIGTPDALFAALHSIWLVPDGLGEVPMLTHAQAAVIRKAGYTAVANRTWRCPLFPDHLVRGTALAHMSDALSRTFGRQPGQWRMWRSHKEGDKRGAYADVRKAITASRHRIPCPFCDRPQVRAQINAQAHAYTENALSEARKHVAAAARVLGMDLAPVGSIATRLAERAADR